MPKFAFDQVSVKKASGYNLVSASEFLAYPRGERALLVTEGKVQFLSDGQPIPLREALQSIRAASNA